MVKRLMLVAALLLPAGLAMAEEGEGLLHAGTDINSVPSLQRGARDFMNYCSGCHSMKYLRYNRMAADLDIPEKELVANLMFTSKNVFDGIESAMPATDAEVWFGKQPPDLSLMARARGTDYIYSFLKGFYADDKRLWGVNNFYLPNAAMPHVLASLQGVQEPEYTTEDGKMTLVGVKLVAADANGPKHMTPEEYDGFVRDIVNFLDYAGEPAKAKRQSLGIFIVLFLLVGFVFASMLKTEYWKDVH